MDVFLTIWCAGNVNTDAASSTSAATSASVTSAPQNRLASAAFAGMSVALLAIVLALFAL